jgi:hypothetical protein
MLAAALPASRGARDPAACGASRNPATFIKFLFFGRLIHIVFKHGLPALLAIRAS